MTDPFSVLRVENRDAVRIITMNRPDKLNALNTALTQAIHDAFLAADQDAEVRAIVLAGHGRAFCAGADLSEFDTLTPANQDLVEKRADLTCRTQAMMQSLSKPVVSAVQGAAIGGGAGLAIGCDMMVAASNLKFGYPELKHSIVPALVMTGLQRSLGRKAAFEMISLGRLIGAQEALALGLCNRVAAPEEVLEKAIEIAEAWAVANPFAMAAAKTLYYQVADLPYAEAMSAGRDLNAKMRSFRKEAK
ncbi:enoyl-CoA hydratase/isomerase family protein [Ochrobactrum pecoris]|uniref:Enoyl-CoA hydratase/carnithine racemase n=1 Tax=Brucella pecoris TaxID=867683 RepID=A0A5C5CCD2_9HYPH|nr:enoyl-CoA hydratase/isomerase family protein [Brucella pecoris]MBB4095985.1 enoyl-CoA hydratase/carnithine racemase [Brucella pecoris]NKW81517.1 enoyl-CoA hydratase/isomerase family protein [Brucella pecoris]TNV09003.1 enoyl-CoA hydratase/isomerase family protein [Brucella pecoris]